MRNKQTTDYSADYYKGREFAFTFAAEIVTAYVRGLEADRLEDRFCELANEAEDKKLAAIQVAEEGAA